MATGERVIDNLRGAIEVLNSMPDGVALVSADGAFLFVNRRMEEITGYSGTELLSLGVEDLVPATLRAQHRRQRLDFVRRPYARPMGTGLRIDLRQKNGGEVPVDISLGPLRGQAATLVVMRETSQRESGELTRTRHAIVSDRSRLTRRLQDDVIQNLFATGLALQRLAIHVGDPAVRAQLDDAVSSTDRAIRALREVIFRSTDPFG